MCEVKRRMQSALREMRNPILWMLLCVQAAFCGSTTALASGQSVWVLELSGAIGPATADYFISNLHAAQRANAALFVMQLDTPGGLDRSMRDMIKAILASKVPVATYVAPNGARAASAGTYLLYASHIAAMAPATNVGSSTPVSIGGGGDSPFPMPGSKPKPEASEPAGKPGTGNDSHAKESSPQQQTAMERKVLNDAVAYIKGLAELRGRNKDWAEKTVREAANLTASEALEAHVIDVIAPNLDDLLKQLNGRKVTTQDGIVTLDLKDPSIKFVTPGWRDETLALITDPNVAYILLMIGIYGLILEFYHPGTGVPGVVGVICLLIAGYALHMLPVNYAGLALIVVGVALMIAEVFSAGIGALGVGGAVAFIIGSVLLMDTDVPGFQVSIPIIAAFAVASIAIFLFVIGAAVAARRAKIVTGRESMIGTMAEAMEDFSQKGLVRVYGEIWQASSAIPIAKGMRVRIVEIDGLVLKVEPWEQT